jgi:hypothetical protein
VAGIVALQIQTSGSTHQREAIVTWYQPIRFNSALPNKRRPCIGNALSLVYVLGFLVHCSNEAFIPISIPHVISFISL